MKVPHLPQERGYGEGEVRSRRRLAEATSQAAVVVLLRTGLEDLLAKHISEARSAALTTTTFGRSSQVSTMAKATCC